MCSFRYSWYEGAWWWWSYRTRRWVEHREPREQAEPESSVEDELSQSLKRLRVR
jgi:hypothetical protein